jgi:hypothetical protein
MMEIYLFLSTGYVKTGGAVAGSIYVSGPFKYIFCRRWQLQSNYRRRSVIPFPDRYDIRREAADSAIACPRASSDALGGQGEATTCRIDMEMESGMYTCEINHCKDHQMASPELYIKHIFYTRRALLGDGWGIALKDALNNSFFQLRNSMKSISYGRENSER